MSPGGEACPRCGTTGAGNFCSQCGSPLAAKVGCTSCGARLKAGALYCADCGVAVGAPAPKPASARMPWILSGLALAAFSIVIALLVQRQSVARVGEMGLTGGIPGQTGGAAPAGAPAAAGSGMPSMEELAAMSPREAADRLFERAMSEHEGGDFERTAFFIDMALQAYGAVPPDQMDADGRFHVGLLQLVAGDSTSARTSAERILADDPDHLLGLLLASRVAGFMGDPAAAEAWRARVREVVDAAGGVPDRPEYEAHRPLIGAVLEEETS